MYSQTRFSQATLLPNFNYIFPKVNYNVLSGIFILCIEVQYKMQPFSRELQISKRNYEITVKKEIHVSRLELQRWSLEFVIFFSKVYIWDLGLRFG
jgi:hypothetical protein